MSIFNSLFGKRRPKGQKTAPAGSPRRGPIDPLLLRQIGAEDYYSRSEAWDRLKKLANREAAIPALMQAFRGARSESVGVPLCDFLGELGSEACRGPLLEILEYARGSTDELLRRTLSSAACAALLRLPGGKGGLQPQVDTTQVTAVVGQALLHAGGKERSAIVAGLTAQERPQVIGALMDLFRSTQGKDRLSYSISGALGALGVEAIEPLLEVMRGVKPGHIDEHGAVPDGQSGEDGAPSLALVQIPGALERLKAICSAEEFERILVRAHNYGDAGNPEVNRAFGELATPRAIGRLVFGLWQEWEGDRLKPVIDALVRTGKAAHAGLLAGLEKTYPSNRPFQTYYRTQILTVLRETGDQNCVAAVQRVLESDPAVTQEARAALEAIAQRVPGMAQPTAAEPGPRPIRALAPTGDPFVDGCFQIDLQEQYDTRQWYDIPEAQAITKAANAGQTDEALRLAHALRQQQPDYAFPYFWLGLLYGRRREHGEARRWLEEGLRTARSKLTLCEGMGDLAWSQKDLPEAVRWWIRSVVIQTSTDNLSEFAPFLKLSYVAERLGLGGACAKLRRDVDRIHSGAPRLNADAANELYAEAQRQGTASVRRAVEMLAAEYLA